MKRLFLVLTALLWATGPLSATGLLEAPWRGYLAGISPHLAPKSIAAGDLDGDGDEDLVLGLYFFGGPGIAVLRADGAGGYQGPVIYDTGFNRSVGDVALADVDRDGRLDVLGTIPDSFGQSAVVGYWRNLGNGALAARREFPSGPGPLGLVAGDFTGDGFPDLVTADGDRLGSGDTVSLLAHNGLSGEQAGFLPPVSYFCGSFAEVVRAADLDGDGDLDLAVGRDTGQGDDAANAILFNGGAGGFGAPVFYDPAPGAVFRNSAIGLADMDGDGDIDLVGTGADNGSPSFGLVSVRLNDGAGVFGPPSLRSLVDWSFTSASLALGDLSGDGLPDVVTVNPSGRAVDGFNVLLNTGGALGPAVFHHAAKSTEDVVLTDADGDGDRDIVTAANDSSLATVHLNPGEGSFRELPLYPVGSLTSAVEQGDIDGDGDLDIATADSEVQILRNAGDGSFGAAERVDVPIPPYDMKLRDMNGDGALDLLITDIDFAVSLNRGDGTFLPGVITRVGASQVGEIDAFDLDNDGDLDVVQVDSGPAQRIYIARNEGNGTSFTLMPSIHPSGIPFGIEGGDLDHDGNIDLVSSAAVGLAVYPGNGDLTFGGELATGVLTSRFTLRDLDLDGELDLAGLRGELTLHTEWVAVMRGFGDLTFGFPKELPGPIGLETPFRIANDIDVGDLSGDGLPDLVISANAPNAVAVFRGNGDGTLQPVEIYGAGYSPLYSALGDFDADGAEDVATLISLPPSGIGNAVVLLRGTVGAGDVVDLVITGSCPGPVTLTVTGATPGSPVAFLGATATGLSVVPDGKPCAGTELGLAAPLKLLGRATADGDGMAVLDIPAPPPGACGRAQIQAVDVASCRTSDVAGL